MLGNGATVKGSHPAVAALLFPSPPYTALKLRIVGDPTIGVATGADGGTLLPRLTVTVEVNVAVPEQVPPLNSE